MKQIREMLTEFETEIWAPAYIYKKGKKRVRIKEWEASTFGRLRNGDYLIDLSEDGDTMPDMHFNENCRYWIFSPASMNETYYIHRVIASTFLKSKPGCWIVNHIDENTFNNRVSNLEWVDPEYNRWWSSAERAGSYEWKKAQRPKIVAEHFDWTKSVKENLKNPIYKEYDMDYNSLYYYSKKLKKSGEARKPKICIADGPKVYPVFIPA